jgi:8-oxoguanine deaminase
MSKILLKNIYCLMTSAEDTPLVGYDLLMADGLVIDIAKNLPTPENDHCRVIDCSHHVVIPGMVNTHHHFYQTLTRNLPAVQDAKLFDWLLYLYEIWKYLDPDAVYYSSLLAMGELLKTGCTTSTDHHYLYPEKFSGDFMELQFSAAETLGMRFSPTRGSMSLSKKDGGLPPDSVVQSGEKIIEDSLRVIEKYHDPSPTAMKKIILAPCSPFSVTKDLMKESAKLARTYGVNIHTHLAETADENDFCLSTHGKRPLALMEECEFLGSDVFYAHGIHFNDDELQVLAETKTQIAHCPSSNMRLGSGICRVKDMLKKNINVALGVDGSASNDTSDMLGEARAALMLQRVRYGSDSISVSDIFKMATINGAEMLNFAKSGKLEKGFNADAAIFDVSGFEYSGSHSDPIAALLFSGYNHGTQYTIVNGKLAVDNRRLTGFDEFELAEKGNLSANRLMKLAGLL